MCKYFCFSATATSTLHCLMSPHQPPRDVIGSSVKFQDAKTEKKHHLPNDRFLIKISLKNDDFGSSERLPPLSAVPPTNKRRTPQLVNPTQPPRVFFHRAFLMCKYFCFSATATSTLHCLMSPHQPPRDVIGSSVKFQDAKTEKKHHLPNDRFLIKISLKNDDFGTSERLPPLSAVPPQIKRRTPQLVNPTQPPRVFFSTVLFSCASPFVFLQQLHQHCIA